MNNRIEEKREERGWVLSHLLGPGDEVHGTYETKLSWAPDGFIPLPSKGRLSVLSSQSSKVFVAFMECIFFLATE